MSALKRRIRKLRSLRRSRQLLLAFSVAAVLAVAAAVAFDMAGLALILLAAVLAALTAYLVLLEHRLLSTVRKVDRNLVKLEEGLDPGRVEFLQQRILASIETERLEIAERLDKIS